MRISLFPTITLLCITSAAAAAASILGYAVTTNPSFAGMISIAFITAAGTAALSGICLYYMVDKPLMLLYRITSGEAADPALLRADSPAGRAACAITTLRAEKQHAEALFDTVLGALAGTRPFVIIDAKGDILRLDDRTLPLLGLSGTAEEHVCRPLATLPGRAGSIGSLAERALREKRSVQDEVSGLSGTATGSKSVPTTGNVAGSPPGNALGTCLLVTAEPLMAPSGSVLGVCVSLTDLTEQRAQERETVANNVRTAEMTTQSLHAAQQVNDASEHLAERIQSANAGATQQQERTTETATAMEQMNATVMEVARSAGEAAELASTTREHSSRGAERMQHLESSIAGVGTVISNLSERIADLGTRAVDIGQVMNVINDIADQTNLLALNAAIEAARAGDAGRGFAVVADEVRKLAEKTMTATKEVGSAIRSIQESSKAAGNEMQQALAAVQEVTESANASGLALRRIVELADKTSLQVQSIATAAEEQSATSEQINRAVDEITRIATDTMETMNRAATDVFSLSGRASDLKLIISRMQGGEDSASADCKTGGKALPCWVHKNCGREKDGKKEKEMGVCPAWPDHGFSCASVTGTYCGGVVQETFAKKIANCAKCDFFKSTHYDRESIHAAFEKAPAGPRPLITRR